MMNAPCEINPTNVYELHYQYFVFSNTRPKNGSNPRALNGLSQKRACPKNFKGPLPKADLPQPFSNPAPRASLSQAFLRACPKNKLAPCSSSIEQFVLQPYLLPTRSKRVNRFTSHLKIPKSPRSPAQHTCQPPPPPSLYHHRLR